jgi:hypothetical protein
MFWSELTLGWILSVIEAACHFVKYIVGPDSHEIVWWPRLNKDVPLEGGQMHF